MHWAKVVWKDRGDMWQHWAIDNHDGMDTYHEWSRLIPDEMMNDAELTGLQYREMRSKFIQVELEIGESISKGHEALIAVTIRIPIILQEICMEFHQNVLQIMTSIFCQSVGTTSENQTNPANHPIGPKSSNQNNQAGHQIG